MKKLFISTLGVCTALSLFIFPTTIKATDFEGQEDKYMKICSSSNLSNSKNKNQELKNQVNDTKNEASNTKANIDSITAEIT